MPTRRGGHRTQVPARTPRLAAGPGTRSPSVRPCRAREAWAEHRDPRARGGSDPVLRRGRLSAHAAFRRFAPERAGFWAPFFKPRRVTKIKQTGREEGRAGSDAGLSRVPSEPPTRVPRHTWRAPASREAGGAAQGGPLASRAPGSLRRVWVLSGWCWGTALCWGARVLGGAGGGGAQGIRAPAAPWPGLARPCLPRGG